MGGRRREITLAYAQKRFVKSGREISVAPPSHSDNSGETFSGLVKPFSFFAPPPSAPADALDLLAGFPADAAGFRVGFGADFGEASASSSSSRMAGPSVRM